MIHVLSLAEMCTIYSTCSIIVFYVQHLVDRVSGFMHIFTLYGAVRPFGSSLMFGSYNKEDGPQLYLAEPSGVSWVKKRVELVLKD